MSNDDWLTIRQAADMLGVSAATLRNWDECGRLRADRNPDNGYRRYTIEQISGLMGQGNRSPNVKMAATMVELSHQPTDARQLRLLIRQMSRAYRDSLGGGLLERFEEISKLLFCKLFDERQTGAGAPGAFARRSGETDDHLYGRVQQLYETALSILPEQVENGFAHLAKDTQAVARVVDLLSDTVLSSVSTDVKGTVYEELIRNTFDKTENQQFFTPRTIVDFMVALAAPQSGESVCDPACGSGGFLIAASEHLLSQGSEGRLLGLEVDRRMAWVAQMNLMMHGDGDGTVHYVPGSGSLGRSGLLPDLLADESVDVVITNPPFGSDFSDEQNLAHYELGKGRSSRRRGVLFLERCIDWVRPGGRIAIIIDDGVLNGTGNSDVRQLILRRCVLRAVVSLPELAFMPYASVKASVLLLEKQTGAEDLQPGVFMATAANVGRRPNGDPLYSDQRGEDGRPRLVDDLPDILAGWKEYLAHGPTALTDMSPKLFECPSAEVSLHGAMVPRLDVQNHHPSRAVAEHLLDRSPFPIRQLGELVTVRNTTANPSIQDPHEVWRYVGLANIAPDTGYYSAQDVAGSQIKSSVRLYRAGDILFAKLRPELRKCTLISVDDDDGYATSECLVLRPLADCENDPELAARFDAGLAPSIDREYLAILLRSDICFGQLVFQVTGVGRPRVSAASVLAMRIPVPPIETQREIVAAHAMAQNQYRESTERSSEALREADRAIRAAYRYAVDRLCPDPLS